MGKAAFITDRDRPIVVEDALSATVETRRFCSPSRSKTDPISASTTSDASAPLLVRGRARIGESLDRSGACCTLHQGLVAAEKTKKLSSRPLQNTGASSLLAMHAVTVRALAELSLHADAGLADEPFDDLVSPHWTAVSGNDGDSALVDGDGAVDDQFGRSDELRGAKPMVRLPGVGRDKRHQGGGTVTASNVREFAMIAF